MKTKIQSIILHIQDLQQTINHGRGLNCIDTVLFFLQKNQTQKAVACIHNEWDKISAYPIMAEYLNATFELHLL